MRNGHPAAMGFPSFQHLAPPLRLFSGDDCLRHLGRELARIGSRRAVVFCGRSLARGGTPLDDVRAALDDRCAGVFEGVRAHSPLPAVQAGAELLRALDADAVVALGGGSAAVTARGAAILLAEPGEARTLATVTGPKGELTSPKLLAPKLPQLIVPTTPNTAMAKAGTALFDPGSGERLALFDPKTRAQSIFVHPGCIMSAPGDLVRSASLDTFALAVEGLLSRSGDPIADALLMHAVRLLAPHLRDPAGHDDPAIRAEMMLSAILCGQGTDHTGAGIATVLGHAIGARYGVDNGAVKAAVLPHAVRFNGAAAAAGLHKVAGALGLPDPSAPAVADAVERILAGGHGTGRRLRALGVPQTALPGIAGGAVNDWFLRGNPRRVEHPADLQHVLEQAW